MNFGSQRMSREVVSWFAIVKGEADRVGFMVDGGARLLWWVGWVLERRAVGRGEAVVKAVARESGALE